MDIEVTRWRVFTTSKAQPHICRNPSPFFLTALSALAVRFTMGGICGSNAGRQHQSLLSEHVVRKSNKSHHLRGWAPQGENRSQLLQLRQVRHRIKALASSIPLPVLARRKVQLEPARCTPQQAQVQRARIFCWWPVVMRLAFTPFCISVERLEHIICDRLCHRELLLAQRRHVASDDKPVTFEKLVVENTQTRVTLLTVLHRRHRSLHGPNHSIHK